MSEKKKSGPFTKTGKANSSKNATTHGLTALQPSSSSDQQLLQNFVAELSDYYHPESPLEKLQIERIALYRAKLARLYLVEENKLKIQTLDQSEPKKILDELKIKGLTKGMVLEIIKHEKLTLPCGFSTETLATIVQEINEFQGTLKVQGDLDKHFPTLVQFLSTYQSLKNDYPQEQEQQLEFITQKIKIALDSGDAYRESSRTLLDLLDIIQADEKEDSTEDDELDQYIQNTQAEYNLLKEAKQQWYKEHHKTELAMEKLVHGRVMLQLKLFKELQEEVQKAHDQYEKYLLAKELIVNSITLSVTESDLFLRYQTTWERRLSSAIGELLALQKQKI